MRHGRFAALALAISCAPRHEAPEAAAPARDVNVLIVVLDACRADKLSAYGFARPTTPELDAIARDPDAVLFRRHYAPAAWTKPSTMSLFTGLYPSQHGVYLGSEKADQLRERGQLVLRSQELAPEVPTLAERVRERGHFTFSLVPSRHLHPGYGFGRGFDVARKGDESRGDADRLEAALELARSRPGPFFGYLHLLACHNPFPESKRDAEYFARFDAPYDEAAARRRGVDFANPELRHLFRPGGPELTQDDERRLHLSYEAQLRFVDRHLVGRLETGLRELGLWDDTLLVISADHGEQLYEHRGFGHVDTLWDEVLHIPLIVKFPRGRRPPNLGAEVHELTSTVDLFPAILAYLDAPVREGLPGRPIFAGEFGRFAQAERTWLPKGHRRATYSGSHKLIETHEGALLFELSKDASERNDLSAFDRERTEALLALSRRIEVALRTSARPSQEFADPLDEEAAANLRALGYLHPN